MMHDLRPYPAMKDSGVPWLGLVPEHWEVTRSKWLFSSSKELAQPNDVQLSATQAYGVIPQDEYERRSGARVVKISMHLDKRKHVEKDDFIISMRSFQGGLERAWASGAIRSSYVVLKPRLGVDVGCFSYLLKSHDYIRALQTTGGFIRDGQDLTESDFRKVDLPLIPLEEQAAIVRFLDHADRRIRKAIAAKQRLIRLLQEQKQVVIHQAVTRGLDPDVKLKPSGVDWLGDVPERWEVKRLKWVTRLQRGYDLPTDKRLEGPYPVVSSGGVTGHHSEYIAEAPGVVMGRYGSTDAIFYVNEPFWPHNTSLFVTNFSGNLPLWCFYLLSIISKDGHANKSAVPGVDRKDLYEIEVAVPNTVDQLAIVKHVQKVEVAFLESTARAQSEIALLREYRTRLIADVVTGKLDVRAAAARLPEPDALPDELDGAEAGDSELEADERGEELVEA
jgi:type I restriction enzyme S subunit